MEHKLEQ